MGSRFRKPGISHQISRQLVFWSKLMALMSVPGPSWYQWWSVTLKSMDLKGFSYIAVTVRLEAPRKRPNIPMLRFFPTFFSITSSSSTLSTTPSIYSYTNTTNHQYQPARSRSPPQKNAVVFLTNRTHPRRSQWTIQDARVEWYRRTSRRLRIASKCRRNPTRQTSAWRC